LQISYSKCCFPILGVDFLRFHRMLIYPSGHSFLDSTGKWLAGLARPKWWSALFSRTALSWRFPLSLSTCSPLPTTLRAMGWSSACTGKSKMPCVHLVQALCGTPIYPGCCMQHQRRILLSHQQSRWQEPLSSSQDSCCTCRILHVLMCLHYPRSWQLALAAGSLPAHLGRAEHVYVCVGGQ
jgi:hypothetical protein